MRFKLSRLAGLIVPALALAATAFLPTSASAQTPDEIIKRGKVVIAIDTTVPPYGMLDSTTSLLASTSMSPTPSASSSRFPWSS